MERRDTEVLSSLHLSARAAARRTCDQPPTKRNGSAIGAGRVDGVVGSGNSAAVTGKARKSGVLFYSLRKQTWHCANAMNGRGDGRGFSG